jgi:hypothetical protein
MNTNAVRSLPDEQLLRDLEFHHVIPFAEGGETTVADLQLRCRGHNDYEAREHFAWSLLRERMDYSASRDRFGFLARIAHTCLVH